MRGEIDLCKNLYGIDQNIRMAWSVLASGKIKNLQINSPQTNFKQCVENVITGVNYGTPQRAAKPATKYSKARAYIPAKLAEEVVINPVMF